MAPLRTVFLLAIAVGIAGAGTAAASDACPAQGGPEKIHTLDIGSASSTLKVPESWIYGYAEGSHAHLNIPFVRDGHGSCMRVDLKRKRWIAGTGSPFYKTNPSVADFQDRYLKTWQPRKVLDGSVWFDAEATDASLFSAYRSLFGKYSAGGRQDIVFFTPVEEHRYEAAHCGSRYIGRIFGRGLCYLAVELGEDFTAVAPTEGTSFQEISRWHDDLTSILQDLIMATERESSSGETLSTRSVEGAQFSIPKTYRPRLTLRDGRQWSSRYVSLEFDYSFTERSISPAENDYMSQTSSRDRVMFLAALAKSIDALPGKAPTIHDELICGSPKDFDNFPDGPVKTCRATIELDNGIYGWLLVHLPQEMEINTAQVIGDVREFLATTAVVALIEPDRLASPGE